jgi:choline-sulfatase
VASIRTRTHRLVRRPQGVSELYDLEADSRELRNVYDDPAYASVQRDLERRMLDWYVHTADVVPFREHPRGVPGTVVTS